MEPTIFIGPARIVFNGIRWLRGVRHDHEEMGELLEVSITLAIDPETVAVQADAAVEAAAEAIGRALGSTPFPEPSAGFVKRLASKAPFVGHIRRRPKKRLVNEPHPAELLQQWIEKALRAEGVEEKLGEVTRDGRGVTPGDVLRRFRWAFDTALVRHPISDLRAELIEELTQRESSERFVERTRRAAKAAVAGGATAGVLAGELADLSGIDSLEAALLGAGVGIVTAGAGAAIARSRRRWTVRSVGRDAALRLIGEIVNPDSPSRRSPAFLRQPSAAPSTRKARLPPASARRLRSSLSMICGAASFRTPRRQATEIWRPSSINSTIVCGAGAGIPSPEQHGRRSLKRCSISWRSQQVGYPNLRSSMGLANHSIDKIVDVDDTREEAEQHSWTCPNERLGRQPKTASPFKRAGCPVSPCASSS